MRWYGPHQLRDHLNLQPWQWRRARSEGLIPAPDPTKARWAAAAVDDLTARRDQLIADLGTIEDCGAFNAATQLTERLGIDVDTNTVVELAHLGHVRTVGTFRGYNIYSGRDLETITDPAVVQAAAGPGRLHSADQACHILGIARGWVKPRLWNPNPRRGGGDIALYRHGDLTALRDNPAIGWAAIRAVPAGQRSIIPDPAPEA